MKHDLTLAICVYNCEKYVEETLECIINQSYQKFDLLIVNDCSSDSTPEVVKAFFEKHPREYILVNFEVNKGLAAGRHYVERNVDTRYLIFVDADDCPYPTFVEKLYLKIKSDSDLMAVGCYLEFIDEASNKIAGGQFLGDVEKESFYERAKNNKLIFMGSNAVFDRRLAVSVGGRAIDGFLDGEPRYQDLCEDLDLWTRMSDYYVDGKAIIVIPEVLMKYRKHSQGLSSSSFNMFLRMRHIKTNLLHRRAKEPELSFTEFYHSLSEKEMRKLKRESKAADGLRNGFFLAKKGKVWNASKFLFQSFIADPKYLWQKIKSNSGIFR